MYLDNTNNICMEGRMYVVYLWYQSLMIQGHVSRVQAFVHKDVNQLMKI